MSPLPGSYAILMAGQLSEREGMGLPLRDSPVFRRASEEYGALTGGRFQRWMTEAPQGEISDTFTAPAVMVLYDCLCGKAAEDRWGPPAVAAGYSLGFYAAAILAGCVSPALILEWLERVNDCNRRTFPSGEFSLLAVTGLSSSDLEGRFAEWGLSRMTVANLNNGRQIVVAGPSGEAAEALNRLAGVALDVRKVPLDIPLHTPYMAPARHEVAAWWATVPVGTPTCVLLSPVDGRPISDGPAFKAAMLDSLVSPTRWQDVMERLKEFRVAWALDVSPGGELGRMSKWAFRELEILPASRLWKVDR